GIGTTSPSQKLHVSGNVRVTGAYYDSGNSPGTAGQVLSSTVTGTDWIAASGGGLWEDAGDYINPVGTVSDNIKVADVQDYEYGFYSDMNTGTALGYGGRFEHTTSGNGSYGIRAEANYTGAGNTSYTYGGFFRSTSTSQDGYGVYVDVDNASGSGGWAKGVDVNVDNNGTSYSFGIEIDVNNEGTSACGVDIDVDNNGTTFPTYGVKVDAYGMNSAGTGDCFAGDFYGRKISTATSGDSYGVYARATYGVNAFGVYARTYDEADNQYPVCGFQEGYDESDWGGYEPGGFFGGAYGVIGITKASSGTGVRGIAELTGTGTGYGVRGSASGGTTHYGVYGSASGGTTNYGVYCSGSGAYTGTWTDVSDRKFKKNITPMTGILAKVLDLNPVTYEMRTDEYNFMGFSEGTEYGLIAQELNEVFPELVKHGVHPGEEGGEPVEYEGIDYISLTSILVQGMQEQQAQIETQQAQIEELRSEIETLKNNQ
ncbi:tail fiber domain-containing protein, partial [bacterium]|nr:tail fiber domain-containing protein [bacterium]